MSSTEQVPMLSEFPRWFASVTVGPRESQRDARWAAISVLAKTDDSEITEALIRLALQTKQTAHSKALAAIRQAFYSKDNTFAMSGNDRELQVLAAAALAARMTFSSTTAAETALAVVTTTFDNSRSADLPMDLQALANQSIVRLAENNRQRPDLLSKSDAPTPKVDFDKAAAKSREANWEGVAQGFGLAAEATRSALGALVQQHEAITMRAMRAIDQYLRIQDEELQMLWWLTGGRSFDLDCEFGSIAAGSRPLVLGKELADMTEFVPGPRAIKALLSRAGLSGREKIHVSTVINAAAPTWLQGFLTVGDVSPVTLPLHFALKRQLETGSGEAWVAGWAAVTGLPSTLELSPLSLGLLFYRERLLQFLWSK
jgi:GTPase-associated system helical domain